MLATIEDSVFSSNDEFSAISYVNEDLDDITNGSEARKIAADALAHALDGSDESELDDGLLPEKQRKLQAPFFKQVFASDKTW
jgi:hypothetical protein